jgi:hypothetical protein
VADETTRREFDVNEFTSDPPRRPAKRLRFEPLASGGRYAFRKRATPADKSVLAVDHGDGLFEVAFLEYDPPVVSRTLIDGCPHCGGWLVLTRFGDGTITIEPLADEDAP